MSAKDYQSEYLNSLENTARAHFLNSDSTVRVETEVASQVVYTLVLNDIHFPQCNIDQIRQILLLAKKIPNLRIVLNGDLANYALKDSKTIIYNDVGSPEDSLDKLGQLFVETGTADLVELSVSGNHEYRVFLATGIRANKILADSLNAAIAEADKKGLKHFVVVINDEALYVQGFDDPNRPGHKIYNTMLIKHHNAVYDTHGSNVVLEAHTHKIHSASETTKTFDPITGKETKVTTLTYNPGTFENHTDYSAGFPMPGIPFGELIKTTIVAGTKGKESKIVNEIVSIYDVANEKAMEAYDKVDSSLKKAENKTYKSKEEIDKTYLKNAENIKKIIADSKIVKDLAISDVASNNKADEYDFIDLVMLSGFMINESDIENGRGYKFKLKDTDKIRRIKSIVSILAQLPDNCKIAIPGDLIDTLDIAISGSAFAKTNYANSSFDDKSSKHQWIYEKLADVVSEEILKPIKDKLVFCGIGIEEARALRVDHYSIMGRIVKDLGISLAVDDHLDRLMSQATYKKMSFKLKTTDGKKVLPLTIMGGYSKSVAGRGSIANALNDIKNKNRGINVLYTVARRGEEFQAKERQNIAIDGKLVPVDTYLISGGRYDNDFSSNRIYRFKFRKNHVYEESAKNMYSQPEYTLTCDNLDFRTILLEKDELESIVNKRALDSKHITLAKFNKQKNAEVLETSDEEYKAVLGSNKQ